MKNRLFIILLAAIGFAACKKAAVEQPGLDVTVPKTTYKAGDTVRFQITGMADNIVFYSGESTHQYVYRNRTSLSNTDILMSFASRVQSGTQLNQLQVMASSDFSGVYDITNVKKATWTDITSKFVLGTDNTAKPTGDIKITDIATAGKPLNIAFKYTTKNQSLNGTQRNWFVSVVKLSRQPEGGVIQDLADQAGLGFLISSFGNKETGRSTVTTTTLTLRGNATDLTAETEDWAVSKTFYPYSTQPDQGVPIKNYAANTLTNYEYVFAAPGTYTVSFVARNQTVVSDKETLKELKLVVNP